MKGYIIIKNTTNKMDKRFKAKDQIKKETKPAEKAKSAKLKKKMNSAWRYVCGKKKFLIDAALFTAAVGVIYFFGEKISKAFVEQLPSSDNKMQGPMQMQDLDMS